MLLATNDVVHVIIAAQRPSDPPGAQSNVGER